MWTIGLINYFVMALAMVIAPSCNAQTPKTKFAETQNGCKVQIDAASQQDNSRQIVWDGACENGFAEGQGMIEYNYTRPNEVKACVTTMAGGKATGFTACSLNNGDSFKGFADNNAVMDNVTYVWNTANCQDCPAEYSGTFFEGNLAIGTLTMQDGQRYSLSYRPSQNGCLVWEDDNPSPDEIIWNGKCQNGYAHGDGILKLISQHVTETTQATMINGRIEGYAVANWEYADDCSDCPVQFRGQVVHSKPVEGVIILADGREMSFDENTSRQEREPGMSQEMNDALNDVIVTEMLGFTTDHLFDLTDPNPARPYD